MLINKINLVLVAPEIPQNTGNIARLCAACDLKLYLIEPLGFSLDDRYLRRAGLDYWPEVKLEIFPSWENFKSKLSTSENNIWIITTKGKTSHFQAEFKNNDFLIFGNESSGLPLYFHKQYPERRISIPMTNSKIRSLNLATAAGIVTYEALRKLN